MKTILIIKDDTLARNSILDILKVGGFRALGAANGFDGLQLSEWELPDLIVSDIMMPEKNGYEGLANLRAGGKTATIPFIFLPARSDLPSLRQGMEQGADDYLTKPFSIDQLLAAIATHLQRHDALVRQYQSQPQSQNQNQQKEAVVTLKDLSFNFAEHRVTLRGEEVTLTARQ